MHGSHVLVTGGAGFVGSELVRQAVEAGSRVTVVDNLVNGRRENLAGLPADRVRLMIADIRDAEEMKHAMAGVDVVYHLACLGLRHSIHSPRHNHDVNATGTLLLLALAREIDIKRFVFTSSAEVYGSACSGAITEQNSLEPTNVYGAAKMAAEGYARAYHSCYGTPTVVLRLFNVYGPRGHHEGDCGEVIPKFLLRGLLGQPLIVFGEGTQTRDFNFVEDTARAILLAGVRPEAIGQTINVGSGVETSVNTLAAEVMKVVGRPDLPIVHDAPRPGDIARMYADGSKACDLLGYAPKVRLADGLTRLKDWYQAQGEALERLLAQEVVHNWESEPIHVAAPMPWMS